jgi:hypothetical protein
MHHRSLITFGAIAIVSAAVSLPTTSVAGQSQGGAATSDRGDHTLEGAPHPVGRPGSAGHLLE